MGFIIRVRAGPIHEELKPVARRIKEIQSKSSGNGMTGRPNLNINVMHGENVSCTPDLHPVIRTKANVMKFGVGPLEDGNIVGGVGRGKEPCRQHLSAVVYHPFTHPKPQHFGEERNSLGRVGGWQAQVIQTRGRKPIPGHILGPGGQGVDPGDAVAHFVHLVVQLHRVPAGNRKAQCLTPGHIARYIGRFHTGCVQPLLIFLQIPRPLHFEGYPLNAGLAFLFENSGGPVRPNT